MGFAIHLGAAVGLGLTLVTHATLAAEEPERFGDRGQLVIVHPLLGIFHNKYLGGEWQGSYNSLNIHPAAAYFVARNVSLGLGLGFQRSWSSFGKESAVWSRLSAEPEIGYALSLGEHVTFWPRVGGGIAHNWSSYTGGDPETTDVLGLSVNAPFLWHPVSHFFVGLGPQLSWEQNGDTVDQLEPTNLTYGISSVFGGNFAL